MRRRRNNEGGYALLLVFAMAAAVAVKFYLEMPRVAFEAQRNKEGMLVERGEQFIRAIRLYYRKNQKWPQNLDELEKSQETRYLRKRYKDPMTGEDEWRLVHVDGAGQFTDSLVHKRPGQGEGEEKGPSLLASRVQGIGSSATVIDLPGEAGSTNPALQRRASDRLIPGAPIGEGGQNASSQGDAEPRPAEGVPVPPEGAPGQPGVPATGQSTDPLSPGQAPVRAPQTGAPGQTGQTSQRGSTSGFGMGGAFGFGSGSSQPQGSANPSAQQGGFSQGGFAAAGSGSGPGSPNEALRMINQILTAPRQGQQGSPGGMMGGMGGARGTGMAAGIGGLAGVASKKDMEGILLYNEQSNYKKWEFVYDLSKEMAARGMTGGPGAAQQGGAQGQGQQQRPGTPGFGSGFGGQGGQGSQGGSGFGSGFGGQGSQGGSGFGSGFGGQGGQQRPGGGSGFGFGSGAQSGGTGQQRPPGGSGFGLGKQ
ncbi:MAG: hypothetical protein C0504_01795 [Candidatus Solibacter sp.]|nr:hypothetical protein [Candidatus Solibacter sp.]